VEVNDQKAKPAKPIRVGDRLKIRWRGVERKFLIRQLASKSMKASLAALLYQELEPRTASGDDLDLYLTYRRLSGKILPKFKGRPTKKERRKLNRIRGH